MRYRGSRKIKERGGARMFPIIDQSVVIELNQEPCINKPAELRMRVEDRVVSRGR